MENKTKEHTDGGMCSRLSLFKQAYYRSGLNPNIANFFLNKHKLIDILPCRDRAEIVYYNTAQCYWAKVSYHPSPCSARFQVHETLQTISLTVEESNIYFSHYNLTLLPRPSHYKATALHQSSPPFELCMMKRRRSLPPTDSWSLQGLC